MEDLIKELHTLYERETANSYDKQSKRRQIKELKEKIFKALAFEQMDEQDQSRKFCPLCNAGLE